MNPQETGIVELEDLPNKEIYISLNKKFFNILKRKIKTFGVFRLARELNVSNRIILHWLNDGSLIRLDILSKICDYFNLEYKPNIKYIRGKDGFRIKNPKLPFDFTSCEGVRVISGILGDGGIPKKRSNPYYSNSNKDLVNGFISDIKSVLGYVEFNSRKAIRKNSVLTILEFSAVVYKILLNLGLKAGKKVETNQRIPKFIFNLDSKQKYAFISQLFDDDGTVNDLAKYIKLTSSCLESYKKSNLLDDIRKILLDFDILCSIYPDRVYSSSRGEQRRIWRLQINGQLQLRRLYENLDIRSKKKKEKLTLILNSYKLTVFRKRDILTTYINFMKKIEKTKSHFTTLDLSEETGMTVGSCRNTISKLRKLNLIKCVKSYTSGNYHEYGRYVVL